MRPLADRIDQPSQPGMQRGARRPQALLRLLAGLALLLPALAHGADARHATASASGLVGGLDPAGMPPWMRLEATRVVTDAAQPPGPAARWERVTWPDTWRAPERYRQGVLGWYRFPLGDAPPRGAPWAVYLWRFSMNAQVWLNGHYLGSGGRFEEPVARNWNRPLLLAVPPDAWQPENNTLYVRLRVYPGFGHLAPPLVGPRDALEPAWRARTLAQVTLAQVAFAIALMSALLGLTLWLVLRNETSYGWFSLICLGFSIYCLNQFIVDLPMPAKAWWALTHSVVDWFPVFLLCFLHRLFGVQRANLERLAVAFALAATVFYVLADLPMLARWNTAFHAVSFAVQVYCWGWLLTRVWRSQRSGQRDLEAIGFTLFLTVLIGTSVADLLLNSVLVPMLWQSLSYSSQLIVPLLFMAIVVHLALRMSRTLQQTRLANVELEGRVAAARAAIEHAYAEREAMQRERAAAGERERIYRDLHDDLGARLLSLVYAAGEGRPAALAREALAQMRTIVTAAKLEGAPLAECSSTRGAASAPSFVTWPTSTIAMPLALATRVSCAAHSRTCATEPGAEVSWSD